MVKSGTKALDLRPDGQPERDGQPGSGPEGSRSKENQPKSAGNQGNDARTLESELILKNTSEVELQVVVQT